MKTIIYWTAAIAALIFPAFHGGSRLHAVPFIRGDANISGVLDISDAIATLEIVFLGKPKPGCDDAMDSNDDGTPDQSDAIYTLNYLFVDVSQPPLPPYQACGEDPTADGTTCGSFPPCPSEPPCYDQETIDALVQSAVQSDICIAAPALDTEIAGSRVVACPKGAARCADESDGCPVTLTQIRLTLDFPRQRGNVHVEGSLSAFPINIASLFGNDRCLFNIGFKGDVGIPVTTELTPGGNFKLLTLGAPAIDRSTAEVTINAAQPNQPFVCQTLLTLQGLLVDQLLDQIDPILNDALAGVREQLVGTVICTP